MTKIRILPGENISESIFRALQYISAYHSKDFIDAMFSAWQKEKSPSAKNAISQILKNSRMAAFGNRPLCQDTGIIVVFVKLGSHLIIEGEKNLQELIDIGVRRAYTLPENPLRASVVANPESSRNNTKDNTPAIVHTELVTGNEIHFWVAAKGGGSENKAKLAILNPSDNIVDFVLESIPKMGAGWCPPGVIGIGIGGTAEKAVLMAKRSLMDPINIRELMEKGAENPVEKLRLELHEKINKLGIGAQGLGGLTTVLDVKIETYPTHAASLPVAIIPNCAATRHIHFALNDEKIPEFSPPSLNEWPIVGEEDEFLGTIVDLDHITKEEISGWKSGDRLLLRGKIITGRDAAHKRMTDLLKEGKEIPVDLKGKFIYYVGPVDPKPGTSEVVGPAGPTTATRMDKFTEIILKNTGLLGMIGKAERSKETVQTIKDYGSVYLIAVGGAAYLVSQAIRKSKVIAFEDLGMEAIHEFEVYDMPVFVAVDTHGNSIHESGPNFWKNKIKEEDETLPEGLILAAKQTLWKESLYRPRRTLLFVPGWKERYLEKATQMPVDSLIFDWADSVPPMEKENARKMVIQSFTKHSYGSKEKIIRINRPGSPWFEEDKQSLKSAKPDAVLITGVRIKADVELILDQINEALPGVPLLILIENAKAVLEAESMLGLSEQIIALVTENNSISQSLKLYPNIERQGLTFSLSQIVLAARAHGRAAIDGAFLNFSSSETFELHCRQARNLGFDGKTLIHPNQILYANEAFRPKTTELVRAKQIIESLEKSKGLGEALAVVDGHIIEQLEIEGAKRILALDEMIRKR
ncbi:FumA C-terminus/TtdB family hydratase beta subunit [Leptospira ilyithenensis]|uniref:Fumarate hydratase class I n=1 Tax=Leptospira ilyithenensis TaxID=2484901 RepID=A0A4R9LS92_9LEPT|nr:FumA C-terminus/TtdB family hydratase beta subunit [Leptospira ilyithenensis]TGN11863.1 hypothetical protein EHS11_04960 [Leptospira ilyithenensis]